MSSDAQDFAFDDGDLQAAAEPPGPAAAPGPAPAAESGPAANPSPMVVIQYRNRGLHVTLLPPLLVMLAALAIMAYQRQSRPRPQAPPKALAAAGTSRNILVAPSGTGTAVESLTLRPLLPTTPAPPLEPVPTSATLTTPLPGPSAAATGGDPLADAEAGRPGEPDAASPFDRAEATGPLPSPSTGEPGPLAGGEKENEKGRADVASAATARTPLLEPPDPPAPATAEELPADSPELAFRVVGDPAPAAAGDPAREPEPKAEKVTKDQVLADIQGEAALRKAEQKNIERDMAESKLREYLEVFRKLQDDRPKFHAELRQILKEPGDAGDKIKQLCDRYGRDPLPEVKAAVSQALKGSAAGLRQEAKIKLMRTYGVPEAAILDFLAHYFHDMKINTRGGPSGPKGVLVLAARRLLAYPPTAPRPKAQGTTSPVSQVTPPPRGIATVGETGR